MVIYIYVRLTVLFGPTNNGTKSVVGMPEQTTIFTQIMPKKNI